MKRFCLAVDLIDDPQLIAEYEQWHSKGAVWPEIKKSILDAGVLNMEIYLVSNRLFLIMEVPDDFSFERKSAMDAANEKVQDWEQLMWKFQQPLPFAKPGEKWQLMNRIFALND